MNINLLLQKPKVYREAMVDVDGLYGRTKEIGAGNSLCGLINVLAKIYGGMKCLIFHGYCLHAKEDTGSPRQAVAMRCPQTTSLIGISLTTSSEKCAC